MKNLFLLILFFSILGSVQAQPEALNAPASRSNRTSVYASYFGVDITRPGYKIGIDYEFWNKSKTKIKNNGVVIPKTHTLLVGGNVTNYWHVRNTVGLLVNGELNYRYLRKTGFMYQAAVGMGYFHTFLQGDTYTVSDNNEVNRVTLAGQSNFSWSAALGIGYDYSYTRGKPWAWQAKIVRFMQTPFGPGNIYYGALELGVIYHLKSKI